LTLREEVTEDEDDDEVKRGVAGEAKPDSLGVMKILATAVGYYWRLNDWSNVYWLAAKPVKRRK
jgi:hypothetical protein